MHFILIFSLNLVVLFANSNLRKTFMKNINIDDILLLPKMIAIKWNGDQELFVDYVLLRKSCPCAFCAGDKDALGNIYGGLHVHAENDLHVLKFSKVGHYGLRLFFSDGHSDGIYTFPFLIHLGEKT